MRTNTITMLDLDPGDLRPEHVRTSSESSGGSDR
jgi:hypothetical protein